MSLEQNGHRYQALSAQCQTVVLDERALCFASESTLLKPAYYRLDFVYKDYTPHQVQQIVSDCMQGVDVKNTFKGNARNQKI